MDVNIRAAGDVLCRHAHSQSVFDDVLPCLEIDQREFVSQRDRVAQREGYRCRAAQVPTLNFARDQVAYRHRDDVTVMVGQKVRHSGCICHFSSYAARGLTSEDEFGTV